MGFAHSSRTSAQPSSPRAPCRPAGPSRHHRPSPSVQRATLPAARHTGSGPSARQTGRACWWKARIRRSGVWRSQPQPSCSSAHLRWWGREPGPWMTLEAWPGSSADGSTVASEVLSGALGGRRHHGLRGPSKSELRWCARSACGGLRGQPGGKLRRWVFGRPHCPRVLVLVVREVSSGYQVPRPWSA